MFSQHQLHFSTKGRGMLDLTADINACVNQSLVTTGLCHLFLTHTSASLIICENADPQVQKDLENFMQRFILDGDPIFRHTAEGIDDMPAHVRTVLTTSFLTIPVTNKALALGTWQGIYLWEHRLRSHSRKLIVTIQGD